MSALEESLAWALRMFAPEVLRGVRQYVIPETGRKHAWDFAWPESRLVVDVQGGFYAKGRSGHTGASIEKDIEKLNLATCAGYRVLLFGPKDCAKRRLGDTVDTIKAALVAPR